MNSARTLSLALLLVASSVDAQPAIPRSFLKLPSSNGHTAILADFTERKLTHFREQLPATEEPLLDGAGNEVWLGNQPQVVRTRDLLYDAFFGIRVGGQQRWLTTVPIGLDDSGYAPWAPGATGGTGVIAWRQQVGTLELTTYAFAPRGLPRAGFVMAVRARNTGNIALDDVAAFSLHNYHLGFGRPGVMNDAGENGETLVVDVQEGHVELLERAFAGVVVTRSLGLPAHRAAWNAGTPAPQNGFNIVADGSVKDLPDVSGTTATADGWAHAFQFDLGRIEAGKDAWAGIVVAHHGDPFAGAEVQAALGAYVAGRTAQALVQAEIAGWAAFQERVEVPEGASPDEEALVRQSAVMLSMAQVATDSAWLREFLTKDGEPRHSRFATTLPAQVTHKGQGAILASLPPGEWTYAWIRDGSYALSALAGLGLHDEARRGLEFYLRADGGLFQDWNELQPYEMPPYQITLTRYHGFGVEETDFNEFGPNLEFDGFGLFLWALRRYELESGDTTLVDQNWNLISTKVADALVKLVDPATGLLRKDSSIWETHWNGRERSWTYTNITAARGLCDAAELAARVGDGPRAMLYRNKAEDLRHAMATWLTNADRALASNLEELGAGAGHFDAAVLDAIAMGLFDPSGRIAQATLDAIEANLGVGDGRGWARNDDRTDHAGRQDLSPWGSEYDSAEWVITNLRGEVSMRRAGRSTRADQLLAWVTAQSHANYLAIAETYEEHTGAWKFNAPMIGFGAGAYALSLMERARPDGPACGAYHPEPKPPADAGTPDAGITPDAGAPGGEGDGGEPPAGCGCGSASGAIGGLAMLLLLGLARRRA